MARDHRVRILRREDIARFAASWRGLATLVGYSFNICTFIIEVLAKKVRNTKGPLHIKYYADEAELPDRACVTFSPLTLHVVRKIWDDAYLGMPYARYILAHEIGHIILHDEFAVAFSDNDEARLKYVEGKESAERQANDFADSFLSPDDVVLKLRDVDTIAGLCVIPDHIAERRLKEALGAKPPLKQRYEGEMCRECGNFTLVRAGVSKKCDVCGDETTD